MSIQNVHVMRPEDGVVVIEMAEPDSLNLWTTELAEELFGALEQACADPDTRSIGLLSRGRAFCAGADLQGLQARLGSSQSVEAAATEVLERRIARVVDLGKPVVAAINGPCVGIGLAFALSCDIRIAADDAKFQAAFPKRGLIAEHGTSWLLPRIVGLGDALDMLLTSRTVRAEEALAMRLVGSVVAPAQLRSTLIETLRRIASGVSPRSAAVIKRQIYQDQENTFDQGLRTAAFEMAGSFRSPDAQEGVASFLERRAPIFPGHKAWAATKSESAADDVRNS